MFDFIVLAVSLSMALTPARVVSLGQGFHVNLEPLLHPCHNGSAGPDVLNLTLHNRRFLPDLYNLYQLRSETLEWKNSLQLGDIHVSLQPCMAFVRRNDHNLRRVLESWQHRNESASGVEDKLVIIQNTFRSYMIGIQFLSNVQDSLRNRLLVYQRDFQKAMSTYQNVTFYISSYLCSLQIQGVDQDRVGLSVLESIHHCPILEGTLLASVNIVNAIAANVELIARKYENLDRLAHTPVLRGRRSVSPMKADGSQLRLAFKQSS